MVVRQNTSQVSHFIDFKGDVIQNETEYKFLGCLFKCNGNLRHILEELAKKARKVLFSLREKTEMLTKNQVNFFEGGSINKGEMVHVSIS
jgi:hypothetical protein